MLATEVQATAIALRVPPVPSGVNANYSQKLAEFDEVPPQRKLGNIHICSNAN